MKGNFLSCLFLLLLVSCASPPKLLISSNIPARVEMNGTTVCNSTPCTVTGNHWTDGYGLGCVGGRDTAIEAFSLEPNAGMRQSKNVIGECDLSTDVYFEMSSGNVVNTVPQIQEKKSIVQKLEELNEMKSKGLIDELEYNALRKKLLESL